MGFLATGDGRGRECEQVQNRVRQICGEYIHKQILKKKGRGVPSTTPTPMTIGGQKTKGRRK